MASTFRQVTTTVREVSPSLCPEELWSQGCGKNHKISIHILSLSLSLSLFLSLSLPPSPSFYWLFSKAAIVIPSMQQSGENKTLAFLAEGWKAWIL